SRIAAMISGWRPSEKCGTHSISFMRQNLSVVYRPQEPRVHGRAPRHHARPRHRTLRALERGDHAAGLAHEQRTGRDVPGRELHFPESLEAAAGHARQVECGSARTPDAGGAGHYAGELGDIRRDLLVAHEREAGAEE